MPLDAIAPDQRAVLQLVLQRGRSYAQIAELLKISEDAVRARAHAGLAGLAPQVELPADKVAAISDFLLEQQNGKPRQATRRMLRTSEPAHEWATAVSATLADVAGDALPGIPARKDDAATAAPVAEPEAEAEVEDASDPETSEESAPSPRPRPRRAAPAANAAAAAPPGEPAPSRRVSKRGGALLIGGIGVLVAALLVWVFAIRGGDDGDNGNPTAGNATPTPTATPQAQEVGQIALKGTGSARDAAATMRLFSAQNQLAFTLEGTKVPASRENEAYAVWFVNGSKSQRLGYAAPVTADGKLGTSGPREEDLAKFPEWLGSYRQVVVSRDRSQNAKAPGPIVLRGNLPRGSS